VKLYPILGTGSLPFRGGLSPDRIDQVLDEYRGIATLTIQSAFRYDYPQSTVKNTIKKIQAKLRQKKAIKIDKEKAELMKETIPLFESPYRSTIEKIAPLINSLSMEVAKRRERMQHIGLFGYSRGIGSVSLPRAIPFTASLYSVGIPPELIGTGRGLLKAVNTGLWKHVKDVYKYFETDIIEAGYYLNKNNLLSLAKELPVWYEIKEDIKSIEAVLGVELGPKKNSHRQHLKLSAKILEGYKNGNDISKLITYAGLLRKSLG
jgi:phosphoenolpyruvate carboxylase